MKAAKSRLHLKKLKRRLSRIQANIGRWETGKGELWAVWDDNIFASGDTVDEAARNFLYRYLSQSTTLFPEELPKIIGVVSFLIKDTANVLVEIKFLHEGDEHVQ